MVAITKESDPTPTQTKCVLVSVEPPPLVLKRIEECNRRSSVSSPWGSWSGGRKMEFNRPGGVRKGRPADQEARRKARADNDREIRLQSKGSESGQTGLQSQARKEKGKKSKKK
ncbi:MAG TPA: hypothetical protein VMX18_04510 [Candidatus Bipolaricaulota bacterium]|nr:hypothetical protein [Candidatus Bipolaricaulota bacterium]